MIKDSEEGTSQLGSLAFTQAEANEIDEKYSVMLQVGQFGACCYFHLVLLTHLHCPYLDKYVSCCPLLL